MQARVHTGSGETAAELKVGRMGLAGIDGHYCVAKTALGALLYTLVVSEKSIVLSWAVLKWSVQYDR